MYSSYVAFLVNIASDGSSALKPITVERTSWFFIWLECFALFGSMRPISDSMTYWPGDGIAQNLRDAMDYQRLSPDRMQSVQELVRSPVFAAHVLMARISSIPRWRFVRDAQADP